MSVAPGNYFTGEIEEDEVPWWNKDRDTPPPFKLVRKISVGINLGNGDISLQSLAIFPWDGDSLDYLWGGVLAVEEDVARWRSEVIDQLWDAVAVGSPLDLFVCFTQRKSMPLWTTLNNKQEVHSADKMCVAWALAKENPFLPLVIFSRGSLLFIYNVLQKGMAGCIRGHGGAITSISVHPTTPHLFCTTSRDSTTRIYDLDLSASFEMMPKSHRIADKFSGVPNPPWPPVKGASVAGAAHGLRMINVPNLTGKRGHPPIEREGAGRGRAVKIWPVRPSSETVIHREDKPLLSSGNIHKSRVVSISWLSTDMLLSHTAPAIMRDAPDDKNNKRVHIEPGELAVWQWLGLDRFFPATHEEANIHGLRGCASDYYESGSYKVIAVHRFDDTQDHYTAPSLSVYQSHTHGPLISYVVPGDTKVNLVPVEQLEPRQHPAFSRETTERLLGDSAVAVGGGVSLADIAGRMQLGGDASHREGLAEEEEQEARFEDEANGGQSREGVRGSDGRVAPRIDSWTVSMETSKSRLAGETLNSCAVGLEGELIVGVGTKGGVWVWRMTTRLKAMGALLD
ncbi:hypothetical protein JR316_0001058 [Psilocybe cubensis]|uniref:Uncharacterized protein n=1 Tax=Psilocybe cubensis TaxID=181762 RepID=A0ACB8HH15_PSICU|nr:hypothetical protein JR316_0001058 [Psilocybe cubensis]KAH9486992.1 hypothetical protein JR316_0001058 [Psilocybe cubensis]